ADHVRISGGNQRTATGDRVLGGRTLLQWNRAAATVATPDPTFASAPMTCSSPQGTTSDCDLGAIHGAGGTMWVAVAETDTVLSTSGAGWSLSHAGVIVGDLFAISANDVVFTSSGQSALPRWNGTSFVREDTSSSDAMPILFQPPGGPTLLGGLSGIVEHR